MRLPTVFRDSDVFIALGNDEQRALVARLQHYEEVSEAASSISGLDDEAFREVIDNIELDIFAILSLGTGSSAPISAYSLHASWISGCEGEAMEMCVSPHARNFLRAPFSVALGGIASHREWVSRWAEHVQETIKAFVDAPSFTFAMTQILVLDALFALYLSYAAMARLDPALI